MEEISLKKIWKWILLGVGVVIGYVFFLQKEPIELDPRPDTKKLPKLPKRPANIDWVKRAEKDLNELNKQHDKAKKSQKTYLDLVNEREKDD